MRAANIRDRTKLDIISLVVVIWIISFSRYIPSFARNYDDDCSLDISWGYNSDPGRYVYTDTVHPIIDHYLVLCINLSLSRGMLSP
jgi:hypothetical protein